MGVIAPKEGQGGSVISSPGSPAPITHSSGQEKNLLLSVSLRGPKGERGEQGPPGGVTSVNTKTGDVSLSAVDVGADVAGTATGAVATHEAAADPHPQYERSLSAGTNIAIDRTDPANPVISATGGGGGAVDSVDGQTGDVDLSGSYVPMSHEGSGGTAHANAVAGGAPGFMTGADKAKLDGIATGATANSTNATLLSRSNHTGTQTASTISDLAEVTQDMVGAMIVAGTNVSVSYNDVAGTLTISATGGGSGMTNPMTTAGDIIVGSSGGTPTRLGLGSPLQSLRVNAAGTGLEYAAPAGIHCIPVACSDETTALTAGTNKVTFRMPYAFTLSGIRGSLTTAQVSGAIFTVNVKINGTSILSTKLTLDNTEKSSFTATIPAVISSASIPDDAEVTIDIDQIGDGTAKGLKVYLIGVRA